MDALVERGQFDAAITSLNRVLRDVRQPELRMGLLLRKGQWLNELARYSDALQPLKGAFIYDPENPALLLELARASAGAGNTRDANQYLHQAMHGPRSHEIAEKISGFQLPAPVDISHDDE
jgi:predicted Zn-dependent protease